MRFSVKFVLLLSTLILFNCAPEKKEFLQLSGEVIGVESKSIMLLKPNQDTRFDSLLEIPIINGKFSYEEELQHPEVVYLAYSESVENGMYRPMRLFLENENIHLTVYPEKDHNKNTVKGGRLNEEFVNYTKAIDSLFKPREQAIRDSLRVLMDNNEYNSEAANTIYAKLRDAENHDEKVVIFKELDNLIEKGAHLKPRAKRLESLLDLILDEKKAFQDNYIDRNPSLVSYSFFLHNLIYDKKGIDVAKAQNTLRELSTSNPNHPYNELASNLLNGIVKIDVGKKYLDFTAPNLEGKEIRISDKLEGQVALLDLWATWCGPCIARTRTMVPLYEKYKDRGFTIVGVAGEFNNTDKLVKFLDKEKWDWLNLVELDRKNNLWQKYGLGIGGGGMFLIDKDGIILAIDPTAEEVEKVIETSLN